MPQTNFVKWIVTDYEYYHAMVEKDPATLYFLKDTLEIYKGEQPYTRSAVKVDSAESFPEYGGNTLYIYDNKLYMHNGLSWEIVLDASGANSDTPVVEPITILTGIDPDKLTGDAVSDKAVVDYVTDYVDQRINELEIPEPSGNITIKEDINPEEITGEAVSDKAVIDYVTGIIDELPEPVEVTVKEDIDPDILTGEAVSDKAVVDYIEECINKLPEPTVIPDDAATVKITSDITVVTATGKYAAGDVIPKGTSVEEIIIGLTSTPITYKKPTLSVSYSPNISTMEAESSQNITITPTFTQNDGGEVTTVYITATVDGVVNVIYDGTEISTQTATIAPTTEGSVVIKTVVSYADGPNAIQVPASTLSATKTITVTAKEVVDPDPEPPTPEVPYVYFTADTNKGVELTPESIKEFNKVEATETSFEVDCVTDSNRVVIAIPSDKRIKKITSSNLGYNVLTTFTQSTIAMDESTEYKLYVYETDIPFPTDDIYEVTLA